MALEGATWAIWDKGLAIVASVAGEAETEIAARVITERMTLLNCIVSTTVVVVMIYRSMVREKSKI
jgi:hypothetical protein